MHLQPLVPVESWVAPMVLRSLQSKRQETFHLRFAITATYTQLQKFAAASRSMHVLSACNFCGPEAISGDRSKSSAVTLVSKVYLGLLTVICSACQHPQHSQERVRCAMICMQLQSVCQEGLLEELSETSTWADVPLQEHQDGHQKRCRRCLTSAKLPGRMHASMGTQFRHSSRRSMTTPHRCG